MRVLFDTNVLVSAAIFRSRNPSAAFAFALMPGNRMLVPAYVVAELRRVVSQKWPGRLPEIEAFIAETPFELVPSVASAEDDLSIRDPADLPVLRAAVAGRADCIVTGDKDFAAAETGGVPVYTPAAFIEEFL